MSYTIQQLKESVGREMHGESVNDLGDFFDTAHRAGNILLAEIDPPELARIEQIAPALYDDIDVYTAPEGYRAPIDILPSGGRIEGMEGYDDFRRTDSRAFTLRRNREVPMISEMWDSGTRFLLLRKYPRLGRMLQIDNMDDEANWTASGDASGLRTNALNFLEGASATEFNLSGATATASIARTNLTAQDATTFERLGAIFLKVYIPSAAAATSLSSITIRYGNDTTANYWTKTVTTTHDGRAFHAGWNILRFDWSTATTVGTLTLTAMDAMLITFTQTATGTAVNGILVDDITLQLGTMYDLHFKSNYLFRTSAGVWIEKPTRDDDFLNLSQESFNIMVELTSILAMREVGGMEKDIKRLSESVGWPHPAGQLTGQIGAYVQQYPSMRMSSTTIIHDFGV